MGEYVKIFEFFLKKQTAKVLILYNCLVKNSLNLHIFYVYTQERWALIKGFWRGE